MSFLRFLCCVLALLVALPAMTQEGSDVDPVKRLASSLVAAATEQERATLMESGKTFDPPKLVKALVGEGNRMMAVGKLDKALVAFQLAQSVVEQSHDDADMSQVYFGTGEVTILKGEYQQALDWYQKSLDAAQRANQPRAIANALSGVGSVREHLGDYTTALALFQKALNMVDPLRDKYLRAKLLHDIAGALTIQGEFAEAQDYYQQALLLAGKDPGGAALIREEIGNILRFQGKNGEALEQLQTALTQVEKSGDLLLQGNLLTDIGEAISATGNYPEAMAYYRRGLVANQQVGNKVDIAYSLQAMGEIEARQHNYAAAVDDFSRGLALAKESGKKVEIGGILLDIGDAEALRGDYHAALDVHLQTLALANEVGFQFLAGAASSGAASDYYRLGQFDKAVEFGDRGAAIARGLGDRATFFLGRTSTGMAYRALGQPVQARKALEEAIEAAESMRTDIGGGEQERHQFFAELTLPYQEMAEMLVTQGQNQEALLFTERAKGRALLDVLESGKIQITKAMTEEESARERELESRLTAMNSRILAERRKAEPDAARLAQLQEKLELVRVEYKQSQILLYAAHPELKVKRGHTQPVTVEEAAALLPAKGAFLDFLVGEKRTYLFVLTKTSDGPAIPKLVVYTIEVTAEELQKKAEELRRREAEHDQNFRTLARELYALLLRPARRQLADKNALVIIPDGPLWSLPFQALQNGNQYLLEKYAIAYAPSLTVLKEMMGAHGEGGNLSREGDSPGLLAMADPALGKEVRERIAPVYREDQLEPLPEARREVQELQQLYGVRQSQIYTGGEAREDRFKTEAGKFRVLHLATHGLLDNVNPMYSNVLLSPGEAGKEDGLLEAREIMQMDLKANLVVLSACETARGQISPGEGVIGLSWAFFVAGTSTTVVSQWKVASTSTEELMLAFHRALKAERTTGNSTFTTARALQQAALRLLHEPRYSHPFYWAAFVVIGNPD